MRCSSRPATPTRSPPRCGGRRGTPACGRGAPGGAGGRSRPACAARRGRDRDGRALLPARVPGAPGGRTVDPVRIAVAADERVGIADAVVAALRERGHEPVVHGALADGDRAGWAWCCEAAARDVAEGRAEQAVVCCWTGTGASIAANKVPGVRAALCGDAATAEGARKWNDANVLALSLRTTSEAELTEILDAWFAGEASSEAEDAANVAHLGDIESAPR